MDPITLTAAKIRDPFASSELYREKLSDLEGMLSLRAARMETETDAFELANRAESFTDDSVRHIIFGYAAGVDLPTVWAETEAMLVFADRARALRAGDPSGRRIHQPFNLSTGDRAFGTYAILAITACMAPAQSLITLFLGHVVARDEPEELFDRLARVFVPERPLASVYPKKRAYMPDWTKPVRAALAQPAEARAAALGTCMKNWPASMRPFGLKTKPKAFHDLFPYFAFEIALAVCAYDIDDSGFRDHAFYPRELVDHYRAHIRTTRDAARPIGVDPGMSPMETVRASLVDLGKSKRKGIARWIELASSGDGEAVEVVLEKIGKPRKLNDIWGLMDALSEDSGHAIHADIKDDATVAAQAEGLAGLHALGEFVPPEDPPEGPARVTQTLLAFDRWLAVREHRLVALDNADDAVHAVVVRERYLAEFLELSASLGMRANAADQAYSED